MSTTQPLAGLVVVEIGHSFAAPFAGMVLAGLGAEVIKVENPGAGDHARGWGPPFSDGTATAYLAMNRDKMGVTVDFGNPQEAARLKRLILDRADVVLQNLKAGSLDKYGLGAEQLRAEKADLIYCNIGAFGKEGPMSAKPGYDPLMQAFAGLMSVTGELDRPPVRVGVSLIDFGTGMWSVIGILAALLDRARTKQGGEIGASLFETAVTWMTVHMAGYLASGEARKPYGSGIAEIVPYQAFMTADGWLMIAAGNDNLFRKLCKALQLPELAGDARFKTNSARVINRHALIEKLSQAIASYPIAKLMVALDAEGIPNSPLQTVSEIADHPQLKATGLLQDGPYGSLPLVGMPITFDGARAPYSRQPPKLGEHNSVVFKAKD